MDVSDKVILFLKFLLMGRHYVSLKVKSAIGLSSLWVTHDTDLSCIQWRESNCQGRLPV